MKKAEMVRRNSLVKFVKERSEIYEMFSKTNADEKFKDGYAYLLEQICERFDITPDEIQR